MSLSDSFIFDARYDFPPIDLPADAYVICASARVGGHYLCHLLWSAGSFGSPSEYFHLSMNEAWQARLGTTSELDSLRKIVARRSSPNGWFGAKVHWAQFEHMRRLSVPDSIFRLRGYVFLSRRDVLAQAISFAIARQTGHWISLDRPKPADPVYRREIVDECVAQIHAEKARWDALRAEIDAPVIELFYEDLVADPQAGVDLIARTFGISGPTAIADIPLTKQADERNDLWRRLYQSGR